MKGVILSDQLSKTISDNRNRIVVSYCKDCIFAGLYGFSLFFTVLLFMKYFFSRIGILSNFSIGFHDIELSLLGLILGMIIRFAERKMLEKKTKESSVLR